MQNPCGRAMGITFQTFSEMACVNSSNAKIKTNEREEEGHKSDMNQAISHKPANNGKMREHRA